MPSLLNGSDIINEGDPIQFFMYYTAIPFFGPSADDISQALASVAEIQVTSLSKDVINRVASATQEEWNVNAVFHGIPWSANQTQADIASAMNALMNKFQSTFGNVTVSQITLLDATAPDAGGVPGSGENWFCNNFGFGCNTPGTLDKISSTAKWVAAALIVISVVYLIKGVRVGA